MIVFSRGLVWYKFFVAGVDQPMGKIEDNFSSLFMAMRTFFEGVLIFIAFLRSI